MPRLLGEARRAVAEAERAAAAALRSVSVNPVYFPPGPGHPLGRMASNGGFHNAAASPVLQSLSSCWAELALAAERQIACFHRGPAYGLPHLLNPPGYRGALSGATNLFGWVVTGYVETARAAASPALMPAVVVDPQNDLVHGDLHRPPERARRRRGLRRRAGHPRAHRQPGAVRDRPPARPAACATWPPGSGRSFRRSRARTGVTSGAGRKAGRGLPGGLGLGPTEFP